MSDLHSRLEFATKLAYKAGEIMLKYFQEGVEKENKADGSPVTIADTTINEMVIEEISRQYPQDGVLGEEVSNLQDGAEYLWVCDPIDGTRAFIFGIPTNQFSLALVKDGEPLLGVIYDPYSKRLYTAVKGEGAFLNKKKMAVSKETTIKNSFFALPHFRVPLFDSVGLFGEIVSKGVRSFAFLSITFEAMLVANNKIPAVGYGYTGAHDIAAIKIIVEEAGGKVTDLLGNDQRYDQPIKGALISNGLVHDELVGLVKPYLTI
ncbi:MAG TPA: inositol monophosphatase [Patescibacteria group bacterium]|nr:inositol monophosphatase [Patescibacteria group bacterium]